MLNRFPWCLLSLLTFCPVALAEEADPDPIFVEAPTPVEKHDHFFYSLTDNSFLIEEAYNQEKGVVQHVFNATYTRNDVFGGSEKTWELEFGQEWPVFSQDHQISYSVPFIFTEVNEETSKTKEQGVGDVSLSYRYQLLYENKFLPAVAPTFSLVFPTGNRDRGLGNEVLGYSFTLPVSKILTSRVHLNFNAGLSFFPDVQTPLSNQTLSAKFDLLSYSLGGSVIYALTENAHILLETIWVAQHELEEMEDQDGNGLLSVQRSHKHEVVISPGFRFAINLPGDLQIVPGFGVPIGVSENAPDWGVFLYLSIEHPFLSAAARN